MGLMNCPDCSREISDRAVSCPYCGCPITQIAKQEEEQQQYEKAVKTIAEGGSVRRPAMLFWVLGLQILGVLQWVIWAGVRDGASGALVMLALQLPLILFILRMYNWQKSGFWGYAVLYGLSSLVFMFMRMGFFICILPILWVIVVYIALQQKSNGVKAWSLLRSKKKSNSAKFQGGLKWFTGWVLAWILYQLVLYKIPYYMKLYNIPHIGGYIANIIEIGVYLFSGLILADLFYANLRINWKNTLIRSGFSSLVYAVIVVVMHAISGVYVGSYEPLPIVVRIVVSLSLAGTMYIYLYSYKLYTKRLLYIFISCVLLGILSSYYSSESVLFLPGVIYYSYDILGFIHPWYLFALVVPFLTSIEVAQRGRLFKQ